MLLPLPFVYVEFPRLIVLSQFSLLHPITEASASLDLLSGDDWMEISLTALTWYISRPLLRGPMCIGACLQRACMWFTILPVSLSAHAESCVNQWWEIRVISHLSWAHDTVLHMHIDFWTSRNTSKLFKAFYGHLISLVNVLIRLLLAPL